MSFARRLAFLALAGAALSVAPPAAAQQGPISIPCAGHIAIEPLLLRLQVAPDGSSAWGVRLRNTQGFSVAVVVSATGFPAGFRVPQPERRLVVGANGTNSVMMLDALAGTTAAPPGVSFVLDSQGSGGPTIRVSQCSRWPAPSGG